MSKAGKLAAAFAELDAVYAQLPTITCKGQCAIACGGVPLTDLEARRLQLASHVKPRTVLKMLSDRGGQPFEGHQCIYLTNDRCSVYAVRPFICRAWGLVQMMSCMHGCVPDRWLKEIDFARIGRIIQRLGGGRLLQTVPEGLLQTDLDYGVLVPRRAEADIDADADLVRSLRALHGGRILSARRD